MAPMRMLRRSGRLRWANGGIGIVLAMCLAALLCGAALAFAFSHRPALAIIVASVSTLTAVLAINAMKGRS